MATEKEILLCFLNGDSQRRIASSLKVSRNTVSRIVSAYMAQKLEASDVSGLTGEALYEAGKPSTRSGWLPPAYSLALKSRNVWLSRAY